MKKILSRAVHCAWSQMTRRFISRIDRGALWPRNRPCWAASSSRSIHFWDKGGWKRRGRGENASAHSVLGVPNDATDRQIKIAYLNLAKQCHPDLNGGREGAHQEFLELAAAYASLLSKQPASSVQWQRHQDPDGARARWYYQHCSQELGGETTREVQHAAEMNQGGPGAYARL
jgi:hypothetical protein